MTKRCFWLLGVALLAGTTTVRPLPAADPPAADAAATPPAAPSEQPSSPAATDSPDSADDGPAGLFKLFGMDDEFFAALVDDEPFQREELDKVLRVIFRLPSIPLADIHDWAQGLPTWRQVQARPGKFHGRVLRLEGMVRRASLELLEPEVLERFQITKFYRCDVQTHDGAQLLVFTPAVPRAWKLDQELAERVSLVGIFLKRASRPAQPPQYMLVTHRLAWYPDTLLGRLKMDVGLLDTVQDRQPLGAEDRECFYQMLAAVGRSGENRLAADSLAQMKARRDELQKELAAHPRDVKVQLAGRRELARLEDNSADVVPLFNQPDSQRGRLLTLHGEAKRAIEIRVADADIARRFGIDRYYEVEVITPDSQGNPITFCVRELPPNMPRGDRIGEEVRATGFFMKSWTYRIHPPNQPNGGNVHQQIAPLLIGREVVWIPAAGIEPPSLWSAVLMAGVVLVTLSLGWSTLRRRRAASALPVKFAMPRPGDSRPAGDVGEAPDFSGLK